MNYLAFIEQDGHAWGGFIPELHANATGKSREQVLGRLAEGGTLAALQAAEEGLPVSAPRLKSAADLPDEDQEDAQGMEAVFVELAEVSSISVAIGQAIARSGLTRSALAQQMGTSPAAITRMTDLFYHAHSLHSLQQLARVLGVPVTRFVGLKELALDEYLSHGERGICTPGHVSLKRTPELAALNLPALVRWDGILFWLDAPAKPPFARADDCQLTFEGSMLDQSNYVKGMLLA